MSSRHKSRVPAAAVALVPAAAELLEGRSEPPKGLAALAGAFADWDDLDALVDDVYAARRESADRSVPELD